MAIDTRNKRSSCLMLALAFGRLLPTPDGSLNNAFDRLHLLYLYRGIAIGVAKLISLERSLMRRIHGRMFGRVN